MNGYVDSEGPHYYPDTAEYTCMKGYTFCEDCARNLTVNCQADGSWSLSRPLCISEYNNVLQVNKFGKKQINYSMKQVEQLYTQVVNPC